MGFRWWESFGSFSNEEARGLRLSGFVPYGAREMLGTSPGQGPRVKCITILKVFK
jgi:hypothetical protein